MHWIETASGSVLLAACSSKTRPRVACRRTAALSWLLSPRARYGDSLHIHPFHPHEERKGRAVDDFHGHQPAYSCSGTYPVQYGEINFDRLTVRYWWDK